MDHLLVFLYFLRSSNISPNVVNALVSFKEYLDTRKLLCEVLSLTLLPNHSVIFEKSLKNGYGWEWSDLFFLLLNKCCCKTLAMEYYAR